MSPRRAGAVTRPASHVAAWAIGLALVLLAPGRGHAQERPNVVLVVADDLGQAELGSYGQRVLRTPALDALAARSARFEAAYSNAPVCAPSRCAILTGMQLGHCAVRENDEPNIPLESRDPTLAELLGLVGYRGAVVGKWALGGELDDGTPWNVQSAPWRVGFDDVFSVLDQETAQDHFPGWLWVASPEHAPARVVLDDNVDGAQGSYAPDLFAARAVDLVRESPEPFFLYFPMTLPHRELVPPPGSDADPEDADAVYAAMVARLDAQLGALVDAIEARGIADRTFVVFTSDNGPNEIDGHTLDVFASAGILRGRKRDLYEGGIRVPLLVAGPRVRARRIDEPVQLSDLLPTFTSLAGAPTPLGIDGRSLVPLLTEEAPSTAPLHDHLYFECNERRGGAEPVTRRAVRVGRWKWLRRSDREELYDLEADPSETHDLASREPEIRARLAALAARDEEPRVPMRAPVLAVTASSEGSAPATETPLLGAPRIDAPTPLLMLHPADVEDDGRSWPQRIEEPAVVATLVGAEIERGEVPFVRLDRARADHVVVPWHPALAVFGRSFALRARLRLRSLASGPSRDERQWLVQAKPTGVHDVSASFGLLAQGGDLGCGAPAERGPSTRCTGREIALLFGDPRLDPARPIVLASSLAIEDDDVHELRVHVDRERGVIEVVLDERRETIPFLVSPGIDAEAPIVIGAHHDSEGRFALGLDGELHRLSIAEGHATDDELAHLVRLASPRHVRVALGEIPLEGGPRVALGIGSVALPGAHWSRVEVALDEGVHASLEGALPPALFAGEEARIWLRPMPVRDGRWAANLTVRGLRGRTGAMVAGAPVRVHVTATVRGRAAVGAAQVPVGPGLARGLALGLGLVLAVVLAIALRRGDPRRP